MGDIGPPTSAGSHTRAHCYYHFSELQRRLTLGAMLDLVYNINTKPYFYPATRSLASEVLCGTMSSRFRQRSGTRSAAISSTSLQLTPPCKSSWNVDTKSSLVGLFFSCRQPVARYGSRRQCRKWRKCHSCCNVIQKCRKIRHVIDTLALIFCRPVISNYIVYLIVLLQNFAYQIRRRKGSGVGYKQVLIKKMSGHLRVNVILAWQ